MLIINSVRTKKQQRYWIYNCVLLIFFELITLSAPMYAFSGS